VDEAARSPFAAWESFYVIVGSSGAALTGLQFVVVALMAETRRARSLAQIDAFGTPTIVHLCAALLISAILSAPWHGFMGAAVLLGLCGTFGVTYGTLITRRALRQGEYALVTEDWLWHVILPILAYGALLVAALVLRRHSHPALFVVAATALLLLFIGIHNAWDTVTYIAVLGDGGPQKPTDRD
jgi:hypothetical protein